ncbi:MAG: hypothetical protein SH820_15915, partial [Xanthomonadales bacterium]|nr:hypothetical protein [Xanthomonadales bacterium]
QGTVAEYLSTLKGLDPGSQAGMTELVVGMTKQKRHPGPDLSHRHPGPDLSHRHPGPDLSHRHPGPDLSHRHPGLDLSHRHSGPDPESNSAPIMDPGSSPG